VFTEGDDLETCSRCGRVTAAGSDDYFMWVWLPDLGQPTEAVCPACVTVEEIVRHEDQPIVRRRRILNKYLDSVERDAPSEERLALLAQLSKWSDDDDDTSQSGS